MKRQLLIYLTVLVFGYVGGLIAMILQLKVWGFI